MSHAAELQQQIQRTYHQHKKLQPNTFCSEARSSQLLAASATPTNLTELERKRVGER
jgi:hypothetical protein